MDWRQWASIVKSEMSFVSSSSRFGFGRAAFILRLVLGDGIQEVYREDLFGFHSLPLLSEDSQQIPLETVGEVSEHHPGSSITLMPSPTSKSPTTITNRSEERLGDSFRYHNSARHYLKYLPICFKFRHSIILSHIEVRIIDLENEDDETIFRRVRAAYNAQRGYIRRLFSIYKIRRITQVKVPDATY